MHGHANIKFVPVIHKYLKPVPFFKNFSSCVCTNILMWRHKNLLGLFRFIPGIKFKLRPYTKQTRFVFIEAIVYVVETEFIFREIKLIFLFNQARSQNCEIRILTLSCLSVRPPVCLSTCNISATTGQIFMKFDI